MECAGVESGAKMFVGLRSGPRESARAALAVKKIALRTCVEDPSQEQAVFFRTCQTPHEGRHRDRAGFPEIARFRQPPEMESRTISRGAGVLM